MLERTCDDQPYALKLWENNSFMVPKMKLWLKMELYHKSFANSSYGYKMISFN